MDISDELPEDEDIARWSPKSKVIQGKTQGAQRRPSREQADLAFGMTEENGARSGKKQLLRMDSSNRAARFEPDGADEFATMLQRRMDKLLERDDSDSDGVAPLNENFAPKDKNRRVSSVFFANAMGQNGLLRHRRKSGVASGAVTPSQQSRRGSVRSLGSRRSVSDKPGTCLARSLLSLLRTREAAAGAATAAAALGGNDSDEEEHAGTGAFFLEALSQGGSPRPAERGSAVSACVGSGCGGLLTSARVVAGSCCASSSAGGVGGSDWLRGVSCDRSGGLGSPEDSWAPLLVPLQEGPGYFLPSFKIKRDVIGRPGRRCCGSHTSSFAPESSYSIFAREASCRDDESCG
eukprot:TRINITY_DN21618_c0_g1_i2.p1 TRINITY_DN21618_c0_g1~~TRINITY_DN21618_c0_g1_i2.p1  ORF type:complete len:350 (+),score=64.59 TRINITY_DN21618_c0_g1_i2:331-1380(+)